jgi:hypothetical protein
METIMETTKKTIEKAIIVVREIANTGKSESIKKVYEHLNPTNAPCVYGPINQNNDAQDIEVRLNCDGKLVGISSLGDPGYDLYGRLKAHADEKCVILLTASRTSGSTMAERVMRRG